VNIKPPENLLQQRFLFSFSKRKPDGLSSSLHERGWQTVRLVLKSCLMFGGAKQGRRQFSDDLGFESRLG
jgi:pyrazinamidase/nicotinamidase